MYLYCFPLPTKKTCSGLFLLVIKIERSRTLRRHGERRKVACGKLCCCAVIFGLRRVILCFAQFNGKYNITETEGFNITFVLTKISLQRSWNITKNFCIFIVLLCKKRDCKKVPLLWCGRRRGVVKTVQWTVL